MNVIDLNYFSKPRNSIVNFNSSAKNELKCAIFFTRTKQDYSINMKRLNDISYSLWEHYSFDYFLPITLILLISNDK